SISRAATAGIVGSRASVAINLERLLGDTLAPDY
ncbi:MAG: hypothetical protein ACI9G5_002460, partial [Paracoccaceae bacterium]